MTFENRRAADQRGDRARAGGRGARAAVDPKRRALHRTGRRLARRQGKRAWDAYKAAAEARAGGTSLQTTRPGGVQRAAAVAELERNTEALLNLRATLDPWPVWMTKAQALRRSGLPASWFNSGARSGDLPHVGEGRGRRFHRDEVRAFSERVRDSSYLAGLLARPRPQGRKKS
jgi:hypothetical protein